MGFFSCVQHTPWFSMISFLGVVAIAVVMYLREKQFESLAGEMFDFDYIKMMVGIVMAFLIVFDLAITIQALLTSEFCLKKFLGDKEKRSEGGCAMFLGDFVCCVSAWVMFFLAYAIVIVTIVILIVSVAMPVMGVSFSAICEIDPMETGIEIRATVMNDIIQFVRDKKDKIGIDLGVNDVYFCEPDQSADWSAQPSCSDNEVCLDIDECFCDDSKKLIKLASVFAIVGTLLVLFQMHFVIIARGNLVQTRIYQSDSGDSGEENTRLNSAV